MAGSRLNIIYWNMVRRCYDSTNHHYPNYGARGIKVCDEWLNDYRAFKDWALKNGYADNLTIDRKNNDRDYCPENCRWSTLKEQASNRRSNRLITYKGQTKILKDWCDELGLKYGTVHKRLRLGWSIEEAFRTI